MTRKVTIGRATGFDISIDLRFELIAKPSSVLSNVVARFRALVSCASVQNLIPQILNPLLLQHLLTILCSQAHDLVSLIAMHRIRYRNCSE